MVTKEEKEIKEIEKAIEEGKRIEKIANIRKLFKEGKRIEEGRPIMIEYKKRRAEVPFLGILDKTPMYDVGFWTPRTIVVADDFAKKGKFEGAYVILGKTYEGVKEGTFLKRYGDKKEELAPGFYNAIKKRALRYAKKVAKEKPKLAEDFLELAEECGAEYEKLQEAK